MSRRAGLPYLRALAGVVLVVLVGAAAPAPASPHADGRDDHVDITVRLDRPGLQDAGGAKVFRVEHQPIEDSDTELDRDDLVRNPSGYCGDVPVDVNPVLRTIAVGHADRACAFGSVRVVLASRVIDRVRLVRDGLFREHADDFRTTLRANPHGFIVLRWVRTDGDRPYPTTGTSTFRYTGS